MNYFKSHRHICQEGIGRYLALAKTFLQIFDIISNRTAVHPWFETDLIGLNWSGWIKTGPDGFNLIRTSLI